MHHRHKHAYEEKDKGSRSALDYALEKLRTKNVYVIGMVIKCILVIS